MVQLFQTTRPNKQGNMPLSKTFLFRSLAAPCLKFPKQHRVSYLKQYRYHHESSFHYSCCQCSRKICAIYVSQNRSVISNVVHQTYIISIMGIWGHQTPHLQERTVLIKAMLFGSHGPTWQEPGVWFPDSMGEACWKLPRPQQWPQALGNRPSWSLYSAPGRMIFPQVIRGWIPLK